MAKSPVNESWVFDNESWVFDCSGQLGRKHKKIQKETRNLFHRLATVVSRNGEMDSPNLAECWECEGYRKTLLQRTSPNLLRLGRQCKGKSGARDLDGRFFLTQTLVWSGLMIP